MRKKGKKLLAVLLSCILCLYILACGQGEGNVSGGDNTEEDGIEYAYLTEWISVDTSSQFEGMMSAGYLINGDYIHYPLNVSEDEEVYSYIGSMDILKEKTPSLIRQGKGFVSGLFSDAEGDLWCARTDPEGSEAGKWYIERVNFSGTEPESIEVSEHVPENGSVQKAAIDEDGNIYLLLMEAEAGKHLMKVLNPEGGCINEIGDLNYLTSMESMKDIGMLYSGYGGSASRLTAQMQMPEKVEAVANPNGNLLISGEADGSLLFTNNGSLMRYNWETKQSEELLKMSDCYIIENYLADINTLSNGQIAALVYDYNQQNLLEIVLLKRVPADQIPEKKTLRLGTVMADYNSDLKAAVVNFNKTNSEYQIEIIDYSPTSLAEGMQKMNQEIISGTGPDLIDATFLSDKVEAYLEKGVLEDLTPYLENSEQISREDFLPNLLDSYTLDGCLYTIPTAFQIKTLFGKSSEVGDAPGWSVQEFMEFAEKQPEECRLFTYESKSTILQNLLGKNMENLIDWETGESTFDGEEFRKMLEFANRYELQFSSIHYEEIPQMLSEGKLKLYEANVRRMEDFQLYRTYFNEPITCIGYPVQEGKSGSYFISHGIAFGINSRSEYKEAAWEFISSQLTKAEQLKKLSYGFPSRKDALEVLFAKAMEGSYEADENGEIVKDQNGNPVPAPKLTVTEYASDGTPIVTYYYASTQEEVDMVKEIIDSIQQSDRNNYEILEIVGEEADTYFTGQKTVQEAIDNIQSRMDLYIGERK